MIRGRAPWLVGALVVSIAATATEGEARGGIPWPLLVAQRPVGSGGEVGPPPAAHLDQGRSRIVRIEPDGSVRVLTEGFSWAGQPDVSPDGRTFLFSGRRVEGGLRGVWEMPVDGGEARLVAGQGDLGDCGDPVYMSRNALDVPNFRQRVPWAGFTCDEPLAPDPRLGGLVRHMYARTLAEVPGRGIVTWRTSFGPGSLLSPTMLGDGRVLYSRWVHRGAGASPPGRFVLLAMNWAGTGINELYGTTDQGDPVKLMPVQVGERSVVFVSGGDPTHPGGSLEKISLARPLHSLEQVSRDGALYRDPVGLPDGRLLVSRAEPGRPFELVLVDLDTGQVAPVHRDEEFHEVEAAVVTERPEPFGRIATVWTGRFETGDLYCIDVYESDLPELQGLPRGSIRSVRVIQALPAEGARAGEPTQYRPDQPFGATAAVHTRVLGEVPVFEDGSFHVSLPADVPFTLQTLDEHGVAVRTMRSWMWLRPWNRRSCVGCHEDKETAPPNRTTRVMLSLLKPKLGEDTATRTPDYVHDVRPIIQSRCWGGCHGPRVVDVSDRPRTLLDDWAEPPYDRGYRTLVPRYVVPGKARESELIRMFLRAPAPHAPILDRELRTLAAWIDLGALWDATRYDVPVPVGPGGPGGAADPLGGAHR